MDAAIREVKTDNLINSLDSHLHFFHMFERMGDKRMAKGVYESDVSGVRRRGRPIKCWMDEVKEMLAKKGQNIQEAKVSVQDRG